jgi:hypothetical protein
MDNKADKTQGVGKNIDLSRRKIAKAGLAAPVIMTLASRPVFGAQCLSNMMSGNLSDPGGGSCELGYSPGSWKNNNGGITAADWTSAGFTYGTEVIPCSFTGNEKWKCYSGTSTLSSIPGLAHIDGFDGNSSLLEILYSNSLLKHCVTAYLNASLPRINYVLTTAQVIDLCNGTIPLPEPYTSLNDFLDSTWV